MSRPNPNPKQSPACRNWGVGSDILTKARQRRNRVSTKFSRDEDVWDEGFGPANDDNDRDCNGLHQEGDDENPFESIGKALDRLEEDAKKAEDRGKKIPAELRSLSRPISLERVSTSKHNYQLPLRCDGGNGSEHNARRVSDQQSGVDYQPIPSDLNKTPAPSKTANRTRLPRPSVNAQRSRYDDNGGHTSTFHTANRRRGSSILKKNYTPRFSFQSSAKSRGTPFKTPSHASLPSRALFASNLLQQSSDRSQKRKQRHTFRPSADRAASAPAVQGARDGFVPTFLAARAGSGVPPEDAPAEDDEDVRSHGDNAALFAHNLVSGHRQRQAQRKAESSPAKSGYFVQRLRSLRSADARMAIRLRSAPQPAPASCTSSAFLSRKRRRSGSDCQDAKHFASSTLDVTVSGQSCTVNGVGPPAFGEGRTVILAYLHRYFLKHQSAGRPSITYPCFAWILLSQDRMREQGLVDENCIKQLRFYNAVVIPPRGANTNSTQAAASKDDELRRMPTVICTQVCQAYPAEQPALPEVSFDPFM